MPGAAPRAALAHPSGAGPVKRKSPAGAAYGSPGGPPGSPTGDEVAMRIVRSRAGKLFLSVLFGALCLGALAAVLVVARKGQGAVTEPEPVVTPEKPAGATRLDAAPLAVPADPVHPLHLRTAEVGAAVRPRSLPPLAGYL